MPVDRSSLAGVVAGAVLLAGCVGFAVGLPEVVGGGETDEPDPAAAPEEAAAALPELPEEIGDFRSASSVTEGARQVELDDSAAAKLEEVFETDVEVITYVRGPAEQIDGVASATVYAAEPGVFSPGGPPFDPKLSGYSRGLSELVRVDGTRCAAAWQQPVPLGGQPDPRALPFQVQCQTGGEGLTYEVTTQGLSVDESVQFLQDVVAAAGGGSE